MNLLGNVSLKRFAINGIKLKTTNSHRPGKGVPMVLQWVRILATIAPLLFVASVTFTYCSFRRRIQLQAGNLLLAVVRPRAKKVETAGVVLYTMLFACLLGLLVLDAFSANEDMTTSRILQDWVSTFSMYAWLGMYWAGFRPIYVEFRELGLVCGPHFWPWESIREWSWSDGGYSLLLKMPDRINTYGVARRDVEAIEAILEEHLGSARHRSSQPGRVGQWSAAKCNPPKWL